MVNGANHTLIPGTGGPRRFPFYLTFHLPSP
jgi:hypothetical protein